MRGGRVVRRCDGMALTACLQALALSACYASGGRASGRTDADTGVDTAADTAADTGVDTAADTAADTGHDTGADWTTDPPPDPPADGPACEPSAGASATWRIDIEPPAGEGMVALDCQVREIVGTGGDVTVNFACTTEAGVHESHSLGMETTPEMNMPLYVGQVVVVRFVLDRPWWENRFLTIGEPGGGHLLLAALDSSWLSPPGWEPLGWYQPLEPEVRTGFCVPEEDWCGAVERAAIEIWYSGEDALIFDGGFENVGWSPSYDVIVSEATQYTVMECDDVPDSWFTMLITLGA